MTSKPLHCRGVSAIVSIVGVFTSSSCAPEMSRAGTSHVLRGRRVGSGWSGLNMAPMRSMAETPSSSPRTMSGLSVLRCRYNQNISGDCSRKSAERAASSGAKAAVPEGLHERHRVEDRRRMVDAHRCAHADKRGDSVGDGAWRVAVLSTHPCSDRRALLCSIPDLVHAPQARLRRIGQRRGRRPPAGNSGQILGCRSTTQSCICCEKAGICCHHVDGVAAATVEEDNRLGRRRSTS